MKKLLLAAAALCMASPLIGCSSQPMTAAQAAALSNAFNDDANTFRSVHVNVPQITPMPMPTMPMPALTSGANWGSAVNYVPPTPPAIHYVPVPNGGFSPF